MLASRVALEGAHRQNQSFNFYSTRSRRLYYKGFKFYFLKPVRIRVQFSKDAKTEQLGAKETPLESPSRMFNRGPLPGRTARTRRKSRQAQQKGTQSTRHLQKQATSKAEYTNTQQDLTDEGYLDMQAKCRVVLRKSSYKLILGLLISINQINRLLNTTLGETTECCREVSTSSCLLMLVLSKAGYKTK